MTTKRINVNVNEKTLEEFDKICKEKMLSRSAMINLLISDFVKQDFMINFTKENFGDGDLKDMMKQLLEAQKQDD